MTRKIIGCSEFIGSGEKLNSTMLRKKLYSEFLSRVNSDTLLHAAKDDFLLAVENLRKRGAVFIEDTPEPDTFALKFTSDRESVLGLKESATNWPESLLRRLKKSLRKSEGALFRFPDEDGSEGIQVFITDWSPCPAACAIAIHRSHQWLKNRSEFRPEKNYFTGNYVRHPLTGDLLPVWVADWVKADFGTGAVLVNPAHNKADYDFGRKIGLPIRFALMPDMNSSEPEKWPVAPVIKTGVSTKTGEWDGLSVDEAQKTFFDVLESRGLAGRYTDLKIPAEVVCRFTKSSEGDYLLDLQTLEISKYSEDRNFKSSMVRVVAEACESLMILGCHMSHQSDVIILSDENIKAFGSTLFLLLVMFEKVFRNPELTIVGGADYNGSREPDSSVKLAYLTGEDISKPLVIRKQLLTQTDSFLSGAVEIKKRFSQSGEILPEVIISNLEEEKIADAYKILKHWQKDILKSDKKVNPDSYQQIMNVMLGAEEDVV